MNGRGKARNGRSMPLQEFFVLITTRGSQWTVKSRLSLILADQATMRSGERVAERTLCNQRWDYQPKSPTELSVSFNHFSYKSFKDHTALFDNPKHKKQCSHPRPQALNPLSHQYTNPVYEQQPITGKLFLLYTLPIIGNFRPNAHLYTQHTRNP